ncbi:MAG TPA: DUF5777 family beta-barrel protein, partial [Chitinophagaceae bacterium]|nr:DUF5777 family beta-barrel protein [Chitinophagaceae bacterium]
MKKTFKHTSTCLYGAACLLLVMSFSISVFGQDSTGDIIEQPAAKKIKPVKNTFESIWLIDNQTVMVPIKKSFEMDIMHRFGTLGTGYEDFYGLFAPSNIRLSFNYVPIDNLLVGAAITKQNLTWEGFAKYAIIKQMKGQYPVSVTYYGNIAVDTRTKDNFIYWSDRLMYFNQILIARKITNKLSVQVAPSLTHQNVVNGYYQTSGSVADSTYKAILKGEMEHNHFAVSISARYKIKQGMSVLFGYDQPLTKHKTNNPNPNLSLGIEFTTSSHAFQLFFTNYY